MNLNANRVSMMAESIAGIGTLTARYDARSPQGILEHIVNFLTFGYLSKRYAAQYDKFAQTLSDALNTALPDRNSYNLPETLNVDYYGYSVSFTLPSVNNDNGLVAIKVSKGGKSIESEVEKNAFCSICTVLLIRRRFDHIRPSVTMTSDGTMQLAMSALAEANLTGACLEKATLKGSDLNKANLSGVNLKGAVVFGANFSKANLSKADLSGAFLYDSSFQQANLEQARLNKASIIRSDLQHANLRNADLNYASISNSNLQNADLTKANLKNAYLVHSTLQNANLSEADLNCASLSESNLQNADLTKANLKNAYLVNSNLQNANLSEADLRLAILEGSLLQKANLDRTDLRFADLSEVHFEETKLTQVHLAGANMKGAKRLGLAKQGSWLFSLANCEDVNRQPYLIQIINNTPYGLLAMMDSIDENYTDVKLRLAHELMGSLQDADVSSVSLTLIEFLSNAPYDGDADIVEWRDKLRLNR